MFTIAFRDGNRFLMREVRQSGRSVRTSPTATFMQQFGCKPAKLPDSQRYFGNTRRNRPDRNALSNSSTAPLCSAILALSNGTGGCRHARVTAETGISVYFADPHAPWQRGSNENLNGLLREYLPKGTDLSAWTPAQLQDIEDELNDRPRKRFGYHTPREQLAKLLQDQEQRVATTP